MYIIYLYLKNIGLQPHDHNIYIYMCVHSLPYHTLGVFFFFFITVSVAIFKIKNRPLPSFFRLPYYIELQTTIDGRL